MNEEAISYIMQKMSNCLDNSQMIRLEKTLFLYKFNIGNIDTTLHYAMVKQCNVKLAHKKYMG